MTFGKKYIKFGPNLKLVLNVWTMSLVIKVYQNYLDICIMYCITVCSETTQLNELLALNKNDIITNCSNNNTSLINKHTNHV